MNNNDNILNIIKTFGVGSSRYISCLPFNFKTQIIKESIVDNNGNNNNNEDYLLTVPIGGGIVHWNIKTKRRVFEYKQLHSDVITCLIRASPINNGGNNYNEGQEWFNKYFHISASYSGEIGIWDNDWNLISKFQIPPYDDGSDSINKGSDNNKIMHISLDESYQSFPFVRLAISNEHGNCKITILKLDFSNYISNTKNNFNININNNNNNTNNNNNNNNNNKDSNNLLNITIENEFENELYFFAEMVDSNSFIVVQQDVGKQGFQQSRTKIIGESKINILKISCETGNIINKITDSNGQECTILIKNQSFYNHGNNIKQLIISRGRLLQIIDTETNKIIKSFKCEGSGLMKDLLVYDKFILVPCSNSDLLLYSSDTGELLSKYKSSNSHGEVYSLKWSIPGKRLWLFDESGIHSIYLKDELLKEREQQVESLLNIDKVNYNLLYHQITCCGIDFNENGDKVACGDFLGNIMIWDIQDNSGYGCDGPIKEYCFGIPIRSLSWSNSNSEIGGGILIGLMDGSLMYWEPDTNNDPILIDSLNDGITCIQWEKNKINTSLFAVGTTGGNLYVYKKIRTSNDEDSPLFKLEWNIQAHKPIVGPQDLKFGSINKFAEIWSLTFHPRNNELIATCSEDQTTIIWNRITGEIIKTLKGHTTAVTCVDWIEIKNQDDEGVENILATCADDQTIRVWNTDLWNEILIVNTDDIIGEWHTVTYISLLVDPSSSSTPLVVCATQNGWVFVWNIKNGTKSYSKRVHLGSIEGLRWNKLSNKIISCSSDCLIHVYDVLNTNNK